MGAGVQTSPGASPALLPCVFGGDGGCWNSLAVEVT